MKMLIQQGSVLQSTPVMVAGISWTAVFDEDEQPIAVIEKIGNGTVMVTTCSDKQFGNILKRLGLGKAPAVQEAVNDL